MKVWLISDTHGKENELIVPNDIDMVVSSGDGGTYKHPRHCKPDLEKFLAWFNTLPVKHKVYVPGNHDTAMEKGLICLKLGREIRRL